MSRGLPRCACFSRMRCHAGCDPLQARARGPGARALGERGAAALIVTAVLLFTTTLFAFFVNRSLVFEQRTAANQARAVQAAEAADAGIDWAIERLNDPRFADDQCRPSLLSARSFRERVAPLDANLRPSPGLEAAAACVMAADGLRCACTAEGLAALEDASAPRFEIRLANVADDAEALALSSRGCSAGRGACDGEASAQASVLLKPRPLLRTVPVAALTAAGAVTLAGTTSLSAAGEGLLVASGGAVTLAPTTALRAANGTPTSHALLEADPWLAARRAPSADTLARRLFGVSASALAGAPGARHVACGFGDCSEALREAISAGSQVLVLDAPDGTQPLRLDVSDLPLGRAERPVLLMSPRSLAFEAATSLTGLLHLEVASAEVSGPMALDGALTGGDALRTDGAVRIDFDAASLARLRAQTSAYVRVPGSWRDH